MPLPVDVRRLPMSRESVLALLRERQGEYVSGEAMSRALGISRAGVWKAIEGLRPPISSGRGSCPGRWPGRWWVLS